MKAKYVVWFNEVDKEDIALVGGKGANLGEMVKNKFPVPNGFIVTSKAYYHFLKENNLQPKIKAFIKHLDIHNSQNLFSVSQQIKKIILNSPIPKEISREISEYYLQLPNLSYVKNTRKNFLSHLKNLLKEEYVAVRSSATAEDLPTASFAGQQETFLNVKGDTNVINKTKACWASLFEPRAIFYREENKFDHFKVGIAVPIQKMINAETSGVMFTIDPVNYDKKKIIIEAIYGLGEFIVQGIESPDQYVIDKYHGEIIKKTISEQSTMLVREKGKNKIYNIPPHLRKIQKIKDTQILKLAILGKKLERHYFFPQDIEWAIENEQIYILQTRPITTIGKKETSPTSEEIKEKPFLTGIGASPGIITGPVKIIKSAKEIHKIKSGDILTAFQTNPDYVPALKKAVAVITEKGGRTSHAAIVSRELGIPAVVGVKDALKKLKSEQIITVDGTKGYIYKGGFLKPKTKNKPITLSSTTLTTPTYLNLPKTATKVYLNLAEPEKANQTAKLPADGVGLLRAEFMIAQIGYHPKKLIKEKREKLFIEKLSQGIQTICEAFFPRPVVYRTTDFKTNEYRNLIGGKAFEPEEPNPMLGFRGAFRYNADPAVFEMELAAIKEVRNKKNLKNLWLMIPFVRTVNELIQVKKLLAANGLIRSPSFKLWMMVEIPSNVILLDQFIDVGIDGVSIGSNDLTMLILGTDRDNTEVATVFNEQNEAVLWALEKIIKTCHKRNITSSICGQAASDYPDLIEKIVHWGITSVSINPDAFEHVKQIIYQAEQKIVKNKDANL